MINNNFWQNKKVLITGCTGFKGSWLVIWLNMLGAKLYGYSLAAPTTPSMWEDFNLESYLEAISYSDIRDYAKLEEFIQQIKPEIVIHLAAQPLVLYSYANPRETYEVNVMGTVNLLDAVRIVGSTRVIINVTTDKCYENKEWIWPYRENEAMGGFDPYSSSKGCSELVTSAYVNSYFGHNQDKTFVASARAGNVIGGGDWADNRLIPDIVRAWSQDQSVNIRYPEAIRPWQHVLEPLSGYLKLAEKLYTEGHKFVGGWNFGPNESDIHQVQDIITKMQGYWGSDAKFDISKEQHLHEASLLRLDCSKAKTLLNWLPVWSVEQTLQNITSWYKQYLVNPQSALEISQVQINSFMKDIDNVK